MRIVFEQTGGFMGRTVNLTVDLSDLPAAQADQLRSLLQEAHFIELDKDLAPLPVRDDYSYRITVETESAEHTIRVSDASAPSDLRPLIQELSRLARSQRK
ncbi:MAG TPA: protealysin inhibitor emfourin [Anaerolineales bacterium]